MMHNIMHGVQSRCGTLPHVASLSLTMFRPLRHLISSIIYFSPVTINYTTNSIQFHI